MLKRIDELNFYELLEVEPSATPQDIHRAYDRIRKVYDPNSIALYSLFSPEETATIRRKIEDAYRTLMHEKQRNEYDHRLREQQDLPELRPIPQPVPPLRPALVVPDVLPEPVVRAAPPAPQPPAPQPLAPQRTAPAPERKITPPSVVTEFSGPAIRMLREQAGLTLRNVADITKISSRYIEHIENEAYAKLPARPYLRGFLVQYAKILGADPERFVGDYLKRGASATVERPR